MADEKKTKRTNFKSPTGNAGYCYITQPDVGREHSDGKHKARIVYTAEEAAPIVKFFQDQLVAEFGEGILKKPHSLPIKENEKVEGQWILTAKSKHKPTMWAKTNGEIRVYEPEITFDADGNERPWFLGQGSRVRVSGTVHSGKVQGITYVGLYLNDLFLVKLVRNKSNPWGDEDAADGGGGDEDDEFEDTDSGGHQTGDTTSEDSTDF